MPTNSIVPIITIFLILEIGNLLNAGFTLIIMVFRKISQKRGSLKKRRKLSKPIHGLLWTIIVTTNLWKSIGFGSIVYMAAIAGIDPQLQECKRYQEEVNKNHHRLVAPIFLHCSFPPLLITISCDPLCVRKSLLRS